MNKCRQPNIRKLLSGNIILVGMMGSGKTTLGRALARQLKKEFQDCDEVISERTGVTISHIFDIEGEHGFRNRESAVISEVVTHDNIVLSTGGGAVQSEANRNQLQQNGIVIYLKASVHDLWQRTRYDHNRPLLQVNDPYAKLKELLRKREPLYQQVADIVVHTGKQSSHILMLHIVDEIERYRNCFGHACDVQIK